MCSSDLDDSVRVSLVVFEEHACKSSCETVVDPFEEGGPFLGVAVDDALKLWCLSGGTSRPLLE